MIFAAGLGTRLKPITDSMPKALVRVGGEPLLKHVILNLRNAGFERIVVNVHHFSSQIIDYIRANGSFGLDIRISDETDMLLDTGGGVRKALGEQSDTAAQQIKREESLTDNTSSADEAMIDEIEQSLDVLDERQRKIICEIYGIGSHAKTMAEIAEEMGLKRERVRQIRDKAVRKLCKEHQALKGMLRN